jgi:hypothetical protein
MEPRLWSLKGSRALAVRARRAHRRGAAGYAGNPDKEVEAWAKKLAEVDSKRSAYRDQQAEGLITLDELRTKLADLEETRAVALNELKALTTRREQLERLEHDAEALLEHYAGMVPEALDDLTPNERRDVYKMMRLNVLIFPDGSVEVTGVFGGPLELGATHSMEMEGSWSWIMSKSEASRVRLPMR